MTMADLEKNKIPKKYQLRNKKTHKCCSKYCKKTNEIKIKQNILINKENNI